MDHSPSSHMAERFDGRGSFTRDKGRTSSNVWKLNKNQTRTKGVCVSMINHCMLHPGPLGGSTARLASSSVLAPAVEEVLRSFVCCRSQAQLVLTVHWHQDSERRDPRPRVRHCSLPSTGERNLLQSPKACKVLDQPALGRACQKPPQATWLQVLVGKEGLTGTCPGCQVQSDGRPSSNTASHHQARTCPDLRGATAASGMERLGQILSV